MILIRKEVNYDKAHNSQEPCGHLPVLASDLFSDLFVAVSMLFSNTSNLLFKNSYYTLIIIMSSEKLST